jgi:hypothetical protein
MAWLGEELQAKEQDGRTPFAPRCLKDVVEERLFERRRDLFSNGCSPAQTAVVVTGAKARANLGQR